MLWVGCLSPKVYEGRGEEVGFGPRLEVRHRSQRRRFKARQWSRMSREMAERTRRLHRLRTTLLFILRDLNYCVDDDELNMTLEQFISRFGDDPMPENLDIVTDRVGDLFDKVYVFFLSGEVLNRDVVEECFRKMDREDVHRGVLVLTGELTFFAEEALADPRRQIMLFQEAHIESVAERLRVESRVTSTTASGTWAHYLQEEYEVQTHYFFPRGPALHRASQHVVGIPHWQTTTTLTRQTQEWRVQQEPFVPPPRPATPALPPLTPPVSLNLSLSLAPPTGSDTSAPPAPSAPPASPSPFRPWIP